jgi:hypothetical protein
MNRRNQRIAHVLMTEMDGARQRAAATRRLQVAAGHLGCGQQQVWAATEDAVLAPNSAHSSGSRSNRGFLDVQKVLTLELECKQLLFPDVPRGFRKELGLWVRRHSSLLVHDFAQDRTDARWQGSNFFIYFLFLYFNSPFIVVKLFFYFLF